MKATSKGSTAPSPTAAPSAAPARPAAAPSEPEEKEDGSTLKDLLATKPVEPENDVSEPEDTSSAPPEDTGGANYSEEQKRQIISWLKERGGGVEPSMVSFKDGKINIDGTVDMEWRISDLTKAKFYFGEVTGDFSMSAARLETMAGFPEKVGTGEFKGDLAATVNKFPNLVGGPKWVGGSYNVSANKMLTSIEGIAEYIGQDLLIKDCDGKGSDGKSLGGGLTSLANIHKMCKHIGGMLDTTGTPITHNVLGLLKIKGLLRVRMTNKKVEEILNKYLKGEAGNMFDCQEELIDAGLETFADT
jgi:hypothetical protein